MSILDNLNAVAAAALRLGADMLDGPERLHDYDLPVTDAGAERLTELEQEREAWEANELFDQMASGIRTACGPYVRLPEWFGGLAADLRKRAADLTSDKGIKLT